MGLLSQNGASPLRHISWGEAAVVRVNTLNPKPARHPTAYAGGGRHRAAARLWASFARLQSLPDRLAWSLPSSYGRLAGPYSILYYPKLILGVLEGGLGSLLASFLANLFSSSWPASWPTSWPAFWPASWPASWPSLLAKPLGQPLGQPLGRPLGQVCWLSSWPSLLADLLANFLPNLLAKLLAKPLG